jgi:glucosyl-dolichyl phosphate glucuronosyltransferase
MDVSVVLCTYNRSGLLRTALAHLARQQSSGLAAEIIVVDNNSSDDTADVVRAAAASASIDIRYAFEKKQGISHARNTGWRLARSGYVAFTDDDVHVDAQWIARVHDALTAHPDVDCVGGKVLPIWPAPPPSWLTRDHWAPLALLDYGDEPLRLDEHDPRCLLGANLACRRETLVRLRGFSPTVQRVRDGIGSVEDHEFLIRLWTSGGRALYVPQLVVNAPVDLARLDKAYHRRWHRGHGHFHALLRSAAMEGSAKARVFGVPAHLYRQFLVDAASWPLMALRGNAGDAFRPETRMWFFLGFLATRTRRGLRAGMSTKLHSSTRASA